MKYKRTIKWIVIIVIILLTIFTFISKINIRNKNFWKKNQCVREIPNSFIEKNYVTKYISRMDKLKGIYIEDFFINEKPYKIAQYGCSAFIVKYFIPIDSSKEVSLNYNLIKKELIPKLKKIQKISRIDNIRPIFLALNNAIALHKNINFNQILYPKCDKGMCSYYAVISKPIKLDGQLFIPIKYVHDF